jgi:hypothetical protein
MAVARLQAADVPVFRTDAARTIGSHAYAPGTWIVPAGADARRVLEAVSKQTGLIVGGLDEPLAVGGYRLKAATRIGLWRGANNMPGGWLRWTLEQYGLNHQVIASADFKGELSDKYDAIVLPAGITRQTIVNGLDPARNDKAFEWAYGVGEPGWKKLAQWVRDGGTLVAMGNSVDTVQQLLGLPIAKALPETRGGRRGGAAAADDEAGRRDAGADVNRVLRDTFSSPASLSATLRERVIEPESLFYSPGALLRNDFDPSHPVGFGMPESWPVFFESDQAYRLTPSFQIRPEVVGRYPAAGQILQSGWLLGEDLLRDQANVIAFKVGRGYVVTFGTQVHFRAQNRATYKLLFNALFHGPSTAVSPEDLRKLANPARSSSATSLTSGQVRRKVRGSARN